MDDDAEKREKIEPPHFPLPSDVGPVTAFTPLKACLMSVERRFPWLSEVPWMGIDVRQKQQVISCVVRPSRASSPPTETHLLRVIRLANSVHY